MVFQIGHGAWLDGVRRGRSFCMAIISSTTFILFKTDNILAGVIPDRQPHNGGARHIDVHEHPGKLGRIDAHGFLGHRGVDKMVGNP